MTEHAKDADAQLKDTHVVYTPPVVSDNSNDSTNDSKDSASENNGNKEDNENNKETNEVNGVFERLTPELRKLVKDRFKQPTLPQQLAIPPILEGKNVLLISETGTGKTESVYLPILHKILTEKPEPISVLYVTPLKSLNRDLLDRMIWWANKLDLEISVRHGDTTPYQRKQQVEFPPQMLIVTLETLQPILVGKKLRELLRNVKWIILDEIHETVDSKRGVQLALGLERLRRLTGDFQLIMLSATVGDPATVARFFSGGKDVEIIRAVTPKQMSIQVISPSSTAADGRIAKKIYTSKETAARIRTIMELIKASQSTLTFTNTRDFAEILASRIRTIDKKFPAAIHHSSLSKEVRIKTEKDFKDEKIKSIICVPEDQYILTNAGLKLAKDVEINDKILSFDVKRCITIFDSVKKKFVNRTKNLIEIKHEMGILKVTPNHPILCLSDSGFIWKRALDIKKGEAIITIGKYAGKEHRVLDLIDFQNVFIDNATLKKFGLKPIGSKGSIGTRINLIKHLLNEGHIKSITKLYTKMGKEYYLPYVVNPDLGYIFGFKESDGREDLVLFNTNIQMLKKIQNMIAKITNRMPHIKQCSWDRGCYYVALSSELLQNLFSKIKERIVDLKGEVKFGILSGYLDGDGSLTVVMKRGKPCLKRIVFSTSETLHREYLLYLLLSLGFKPKVHDYKNYNYHEVSLTYVDDKQKFLNNAVQSIKVLNFDKGVALGIKRKTYYGLGPYLRTLRRSLKIPTKLLEKNNYHLTKHELHGKGISSTILKRVNKYFKSFLIERLLQNSFNTSRVIEINIIKKKRKVINFEIEETNTFVIGGIVTHNCTSSLQLGIDIGSVDNVIQYQSPRQVTQAIQRIGRSGHGIDRISRGIIIATDEDDAFEAAVIARKALAGELEPSKLHSNSLDVLAHQLVGLTLEEWMIELPTAYQIIRAAVPYQSLSYIDFLAVCKQLQQLGLVFLNGHIKKKRRGFQYYFTNLSTIPDVKQYRIFNTLEQSNVGVLDEEFVAIHGSPGTTFIVKGEPWRIIDVEEDRILVEPSDDREAAIPGWEGELIPVPFSVAQEVGRLRSIIESKLQRTNEKETIDDLQQLYPVDKSTARRMVEVVKGQRRHGIVPTDKTVLVEDYENAVIMHTCFGSLANQTLGRFIAAMLTARLGSVGLHADPYRIIIEFQEKNVEALKEALHTPAEHMQIYLEMALTKSELFEWKFVHVAKRFGAIARGADLGRTRMKRIIEEYAGTPLYKETLAELETEKLDIPLAIELLKKMQSGEIKVAFGHGLSPMGKIGIKDKYAEVIGPERPERELFQLFKQRLLSTKRSLLCMNCGDWSRTYSIKDMPEDVWCQKCEAHLLGIAPAQWVVEAQKLAKKALKKRELTEEEMKWHERLVKSADLYLVYRRPAVVALAGRGVGPATAIKILRKFHKTEDDLLRDIREAEIQYLKTKRYWKI